MVTWSLVVAGSVNELLLSNHLIVHNLKSKTQPLSHSLLMKTNMLSELKDRAESIQQKLLQLGDSL